MTEAEWLDILRVYRSYGVNCVRFHSHCPPEAAFYAADKLGIMMQPELSHWNPRDAFISAESYAYYRCELTQLLLALANHPSVCDVDVGPMNCVQTPKVIGAWTSCLSWRAA